ncbi:LuxR C-terminal-related transcriptional regulator [Cohnella algarum]|uniref:LuxR C-terminal-related transcriptional regulator n=1 Tax=Cohnella algarum TaxID=2044859 RepID=UPI0019670372|nr:LuxR C-terminal-related transcriptional regulator [Cohnella algarum]MBN2982393.1 hypothetical protein [Cohnella algarum]
MIQSKIQVPHSRKSLVSRPRLMSKFDEGLGVKLTLVSAQAGYGKTTALGEWAKQSGALVAWVALDRLDNDWTPFWNCVLSSIRERVPGFGNALGFLPESESAASFESAISAFLNELNQLNDELVVVLDDYHLIEFPAIHHALSYLLEYLPPRAHFYIASRTDLAFPTARLLAKGEVNRIDTNDLQFSLDEGVVFFRDMMKITLTDEQVVELFRQTEGWVSGLQLAAITLKRGGNIAESIRHFNGSQRDIFDFLLEEVYGHQPASMREFLLATSVLARMNRDLCQAVTGRADSQENLERLEQLNLFLIPLDDRRNWYRYHHLLSDFLQRIGSRENPELRRQSHARAAKWHESQGLDEEAIEHYIKARQTDDAVRLIERVLPELMQSKSNVLLKWIASLPESSYERKPAFELFYISKLVVDGEWNQAMGRAEQAEHRFEALKDSVPEPEWNRLMGNLCYFRGIISYLQQDLPRTSHYFELLDLYLPEGSGFQNFGSNRYQGYDQFTDLLSLANDLQVVEKFLLKRIKASETKKNYPFVGYQYLTYIMLLYEWNRLEEAERYLGQAMGREDLQSNLWIRIQLHLAFSGLQQALGKGEQAVESLTRLGMSIDSPDARIIMRRIEAEQAHLFLRQGHIRKALDWSERCGLSHMDEVFMHRFEEHLVLAKVLAAAERTEEASHLLEKLQRLAEKENRLRVRIKLLIARSTVLRHSGHLQEAFVPLGTALRLAEPAGYIRSFVDEGPEMGEMLAELLTQGQGSAHSWLPLDYIGRLLDVARNGGLKEPSPKELLTEQEAKVLYLIADGRINKEIAYELNIALDTVKFHVKNVYRKLGARNRAQAIRLGNQYGILG